MRHPKLLLLPAFFFAAIVILSLIFFIRSPVLVVTDVPFAALYGESHLKQRRISASIRLFRQVKPIMVADGVSSDVVIIAITEASKQPLCVLFTRTQASAAMRFHQQFPETPVVLFSGLISASDLPSPDDFLYVYSTDRDVDLYRAGLFAGILGDMQQKPDKPVEEKARRAEKQEDSAKKRKDSEQNSSETPVNEKEVHGNESGDVSQTIVKKTYVLWQDRFVQAGGRELVSRGVMEQNPESAVVFANSITDMPDIKGISCVVLTSAGAEYLEKNPRMPVILFSWLDPDLAAKELVVLFDDSVWALIVPAARMALQRQSEGKIPSKPLIFFGKIGDNTIFRMLKKAEKKLP